MEKNISMGPQPNDPQPECKKIQDYIYKFSDQIGMGNFSKVFKGYHQHTNKQVAIKIIELNSLTNTRLQELLNTQTKILKMLSHPNVIGCEQILSSVRNCYIITELCNGGDLDKKLKKVGQFKQKQIYQIVVDIYEGLKYLAKKHIVHRDIKVSNIFINNKVHKIADFGFAQISQVEFRDISVGSPIYMSPQGYINNLYGPKTDVWAFGVLLFELVQGRTPCHDCRSEAELKHNLMKQIDYSNFTSQISNELKNLIIQCLDINPMTRIDIKDIENTEWMKKAQKMANESKKKGQNQVILEKQNIMIKNCKRSLDFQVNSKEFHTRPPNKTINPSILNRKNSNQIEFKSYLLKYNNFITTEEKDPIQPQRKHSTLDKTQQKTCVDEDSIDTKCNNESNKVFYSPKNVYSKFERDFGPKNGSPSSKFQSFNFKNHLKSPQTSNLKIKDKNSNTGNYPQTCKQESNFSKMKNWIQKPSSREGKELNLNEKIEKIKNVFSQKQKNSNTIHLQPKEHKQEFKEYKRTQRGTISNDFKINLNNNSVPIPQTVQKNTSSHKGGRFSQLIEVRAFKPTNMNKIHKDEIHQKIQAHKEMKSPTNIHQKIINRSLKFGDCIGLIHYCRLCFKFACLLDEYGQAEQAKKVLTSWSVQLLLELNTKINQGDIMFNNQTSLINNPSTNPHIESQKKKKLRDVTEQYLSKYSKTLTSSDKIFLTLKEASSFIYNLYLVKGHEFRQMVRQKKSHLYLALICYVSLLDRQTRNLMEYIYEIKNSLQGKQIQKILGIKISDFSRKHIEQIVSENVENQI